MALFLAVAGVAAAASATPTTIVHSKAPIAAVTQDNGDLAWLSGDGTKCNAVHYMHNGTTDTLPTPPNGSLTCRWNLNAGTQQLAIASNSSAALWSLHEHGADYVVTAQIGGKEIKVDQLAHQSDGTRWWLGGLVGGGSTLAYSTVDIEYVDPIACGSGGSCTKKIAGGKIELVDGGQKSPMPNTGAALDLSLSGSRIAYIPATAVSKAGSPESSQGAAVIVANVSDGAIVSSSNPAGVPLAVGLSPQVLGVLSRNNGRMRLTWYDPATGAKLGGLTVPRRTSPELAVSDQAIIFVVGHYLHEVPLPSGHPQHVVARTVPATVGLSLDQGRLIWAESSRTAGRVRALPVP